jgi:hypothetical protein
MSEHILVQAIRHQVTRDPSENGAPSIEQYHIRREALPEDGLTLAGSEDWGHIMLKSALCIVIFVALFHVVY